MDDIDWLVKAVRQQQAMLRKLTQIVVFDVEAQRVLTVDLDRVDALLILPNKTSENR